MGDALEKPGWYLCKPQENFSAKEKPEGKLVLVTACKVSSGQVEHPEHRHDQNEHFSNAKRIHKMHRVTGVNEFWLGNPSGVCRTVVAPEFREAPPFA